MQKRSGDYRRVSHRLWQAMAVLAFAMSDPALAVTLQDCAKEADAVNQTGSTSSDDFNTATFFENFQNHIDEVNTITDKDVVLLNMSNILSEKPDDAFGEAIATLRLCVWSTRLEELGGVDVAEDAADTTEAPAEIATEAEVDLSAPPSAINGETWFTADDFPAQAMREGRQGVVKYDLTIGADGKVLGCQATGPSGSKDLELATCNAIMARARFNPATDAAGRPVQGEYSHSIRWTI